MQPLGVVSDVALSIGEQDERMHEGGVGLLEPGLKFIELHLSTNVAVLCGYVMCVVMVYLHIVRDDAVTVLHVSAHGKGREQATP